MPMEISFNFLLDSFVELFSSQKRMYWIYILSSLLIAMLYLFKFQKQKRVNLSSNLWLHESAILDYKYFFLSFLIKTILILPLLISAKEVTIFIYEVLLDNFGFIKISYFTHFEIIVLFTVSLFTVSDFTRYLMHRLLHAVPILWEFHKVHHSAKVLTPITFYRVHFVENILFGFRYAFAIGFVSGIFFYLFGAMIGIIDILGVNIIFFIFSLLGSNLRHSHIKLSYPKYLENIFISPFSHQIHHSKKYHNKNYGGYLAIWDKFFGTFESSNDILNKKEKINLGIQTSEYKTITSLLFKPFINIGTKYAKN